MSSLKDEWRNIAKCRDNVKKTQYAATHQ